MPDSIRHPGVIPANPGPGSGQAPGTVIAWTPAFTGVTNREDFSYIAEVIQRTKGVHNDKEMGTGDFFGFFVLALPFSAAAAEEKWPTKPISIFIGMPPGGGMDMMARLLSDGMRKQLGVACRWSTCRGPTGQ